MATRDAQSSPQGLSEPVMREMDRHTDLGVRWSVPGVRGPLMVKIGRKYHHGWTCHDVGGSEAPTPAHFTVVA